MRSAQYRNCCKYFSLLAKWLCVFRNYIVKIDVLEIFISNAIMDLPRTVFACNITGNLQLFQDRNS